MPYPTPGSTPVVSPPLPPPSHRRESYAIEVIPSSPGSVRLIGYDWHGDWMVGVELLPRKFTPEYLEELRQWMLENDDTRPPGIRPPLSLTPFT